MKFSFTGNAQFAKAISSLAPDDKRGVITGMLVYGAEPLERRMSELAPIDPSTPVNLKDEIGYKRLNKLDDDEIGEVVLGEGEAAIAVGPSKRAWYGHLVEDGTAPHGNHPGTPARPFARPAFDETQGEVIRRVGDKMAEHIRANATRSVTGRGE